MVEGLGWSVQPVVVAVEDEEGIVEGVAEKVGETGIVIVVAYVLLCIVFYHTVLIRIKSALS